MRSLGTRWTQDGCSSCYILSEKEDFADWEGHRYVIQSRQELLLRYCEIMAVKRCKHCCMQGLVESYVLELCRSV